MNTLKTAFLLTALTLFLMIVGLYFGGRNGMILAFFIAAGMNFFSYFYSDKMALSMYRAQPVTREQLPRVYQIVERILPRMALPMPRIYVIPTESPNAFATGRNPRHAAVAVTQGILNLLNDEELEGVLAHELGHVRNRDILTSSIAATLAGAITLLAHFGGMFGGGRDDRRGIGGGGILMMILAPLAATLIQLAVSRSREYEADATGAHVTGNPYALASALQKLDTYSRRMPLPASPSTAHLFIVAPLLVGPAWPICFRLIRRWRAELSGSPAGPRCSINTPIMRTLFHSLVYLSLGVWLGALIFFGAILAPLAFSQLPPLLGSQGVHAAGLIVGGSLVRLHWMGLFCGVVFLLVMLLGRAHYRSIIPQSVLILLMMLLTAYSQFSIIPRMDTARDSIGGNVDAVAANNPGRQIFDSLHRTSTHVEGLVLLCGIAALVATAHWSRREI